MPQETFVYLVCLEKLSASISEVRFIPGQRVRTEAAWLSMKMNLVELEMRYERRETERKVNIKLGEEVDDW